MGKVLTELNTPQAQYSALAWLKQALALSDILWASPTSSSQSWEGSIDTDSQLLVPAYCPLKGDKVFWEQAIRKFTSHLGGIGEKILSCMSLNSRADSQTAPPSLASLGGVLATIKHATEKWKGRRQIAQNSRPATPTITWEMNGRARPCLHPGCYKRRTISKLLSAT